MLGGALSRSLLTGHYTFGRQSHQHTQIYPPHSISQSHQSLPNKPSTVHTITTPSPLRTMFPLDYSACPTPPPPSRRSCEISQSHWTLIDVALCSAAASGSLTTGCISPKDWCFPSLAPTLVSSPTFPSLLNRNESSSRWNLRVFAPSCSMLRTVAVVFVREQVDLRRCSPAPLLLRSWYFEDLGDGMGCGRRRSWRSAGCMTGMHAFMIPRLGSRTA